MKTLSINLARVRTRVIPRSSGTILNGRRLSWKVKVTFRFLFLGTEPSIYNTGVDMVTGSLLPSHSDVQLSFLTGERIKVIAIAECNTKGRRFFIAQDLQGMIPAG